VSDAFETLPPDNAPSKRVFEMKPSPVWIEAKTQPWPCKVAIMTPGTDAKKGIMPTDNVPENAAFPVTGRWYRNQTWKVTQNP
jgi:hypothetical protein